MKDTILKAFKLNVAYFNAGKILILLLLSFSTLTLVFGEDINLKTQQERNIEAKRYLEQKYNNSNSGEIKQYSFFEEILISIGGVIFFGLIPFVCPLILFYIALKNNNELKNSFSIFTKSILNDYANKYNK